MTQQVTYPESQEVIDHLTTQLQGLFFDRYTCPEAFAEQMTWLPSDHTRFFSTCHTLAHRIDALLDVEETVGLSGEYEVEDEAALVFFSMVQQRDCSDAAEMLTEVLFDADPEVENLDAERFLFCLLVLYELSLK